MKRAALFIGINDYQSPIEKLSCAREDAAELYQLFLREYSKGLVYFLPNPSVVEIKKKLKRIMDKLAEGDFFLFYFAGHGVEEQGKHLLLDSEAECIGGEWSGFLSVNKLKHLTRKPGVQSLFVIDSCRTSLLTGARSVDVGAAAKSRNVALQGEVTGTPKDNYPPPMILCSCSSNEKAFEVMEKEHGIFTLALMDILEQAKCVTVEEVGKKICDRINQLMRENHLYGQQTPELMKSPNVNPVIWEQANGVSSSLPDVPVTARSEAADFARKNETIKTQQENEKNVSNSMNTDTAKTRKYSSPTFLSKMKRLWLGPVDTVRTILNVERIIQRECLPCTLWNMTLDGFYFTLFIFCMIPHLPVKWHNFLSVYFLVFIFLVFSLLLFVFLFEPIRFAKTERISFLSALWLRLKSSNILSRRGEYILVTVVFFASFIVPSYYCIFAWPVIEMYAFLMTGNIGRMDVLYKEIQPGQVEKLTTEFCPLQIIVKHGWQTVPATVIINGQPTDIKNRNVWLLNRNTLCNYEAALTKDGVNYHKTGTFEFKWKAHGIQKKTIRF